MRFSASLHTLIPFAPLHLPAELSAIGAARARFPASPQVACFDTAFHRTMPEAAQRFALPAHLFDEGVRRYGFHGLSYEYVVDSVGAQALGRAVLAHLGNGASMCAVRDGRSVDTTMGFTPAAGLVMGTRAGDIDPGLVTYLLQHGCDTASFDRLVNHEAGLLALSGTTADMKRLVEARDETRAPPWRSMSSACTRARRLAPSRPRSAVSIRSSSRAVSGSMPRSCAGDRPRPRASRRAHRRPRERGERFRHR